MAKKAAKNATRQPGTALVWWVYMAMFGGAIIVAPAAVALLVVGLAPTIAAFLANQSPNRQNQLLTILAFNLAGTLPFLAKVLGAASGFAMVREITADVFSWLVMYGAAGVAMVILLIAPQLAAFVLQMLAQERLASIAASQAALIEEWGEGVGGGAERP